MGMFATNNQGQGPVSREYPRCCGRWGDLSGPAARNCGIICSRTFGPDCSQTTPQSLAWGVEILRFL